MRVNYLLDGLSVLCEFSDSGEVLREYVPGVCFIVGDSVYFYHYDRLGSVRFLTDGSGNVVSEYVYDAFGNVLSSSGSISQPYQYVGKEGYYRESQLDLYLLGQRWYDEEVGRFISRDWIGKKEEVVEKIIKNKLLNSEIEDYLYNYLFEYLLLTTNEFEKSVLNSINLYHYCLNNPVYYKDPNGEIYWPAVICLGAAIINIIEQILYPWIISKNPNFPEEVNLPTPPNPNFPPKPSPILPPPKTAPPPPWW